MYCVLLSAIYIAAPTGVPPAADTDCRLAQPVTLETVYSPTTAGTLSKPRSANVSPVHHIEMTSKCDCLKINGRETDIKSLYM